MVTFEIVNANGFLGEQRIGAGDVQKYRARFDGFLEPGVLLTGATATVTSPASTVATPTLSDDKKSAYFLLTAALLTETLTLALQVTLNDGQVFNYTVIYDVDGPLTASSAANPLPLIIGPTGPTGPGAGASGSFVAGPKTVTVVNGLITSIV